MSDLIARLRAAIDETERIAVGALDHPREWNSATKDYDRAGEDDGVWRADGCELESANVDYGQGGIRIYDEGGHNERQAQHIARHDPAAVKRRCAADRAILDLHEHVPDDGINFTFAERDRSLDTLKALAEGYGIEP